MNQVENGYTGWEACTECNDIGTFIVPPKDEGYLYQINSICYNKQLQRWWFNLENNHSFIFNYILEICTDQITNCQGRQVIDNYLFFPPDYGCDRIIFDIKGHYKYGIGSANYVLLDIAEEHEEEHKKFFEDIVEDLNDVFYNKLIEDPKTCNDFSTLNQAYSYWENKIKTLFTEFRSQVMGWYGGITGVFVPTGEKKL